MKKLILGLLVSQGLFAAPAKLVPTSLAKLVEKECTYVEGDLNDFAACPTVEKYQFKKITVEGVQAFLAAEKQIDVKVTTTTAALKVIGDSIGKQVSLLWDTLLEGEDDSAKAAQVYVDSVPKMMAAFKRAATGKVVLAGDGYWAPSVNARAMAIVDFEKKTVIVILHGDTDG